MEKKSKWDKEYSTSFIDEVTFLKSKGIRYTWVYKNEDEISVWKFKKEKSTTTLCIAVFFLKFFTGIYM